MNPMSNLTRCPDCGAEPGQLHEEGCDVERCPICGDQLLSCRCEYCPSDEERLVWTGRWPGDAECEEYGFFAKLIPGRGWIDCDGSDPEAECDITRLHMECEWDRALRRFVKPS